MYFGLYFLVVFFRNVKYTHIVLFCRNEISLPDHLPYKTDVYTLSFSDFIIYMNLERSNFYFHSSDSLLLPSTPSQRGMLFLFYGYYKRIRTYNPREAPLYLPHKPFLFLLALACYILCTGLPFF